MGALRLVSPKGPTCRWSHLQPLLLADGCGSLCGRRDLLYLRPGFDAVTIESTVHLCARVCLSGFFEGALFGFLTRTHLERTFSL